MSARAQPRGPRPIGAGASPEGLRSVTSPHVIQLLQQVSHASPWGRVRRPGRVRGPAIRPRDVPENVSPREIAQFQTLDPPSPWGRPGGLSDPDRRTDRRPQNRPHGISRDSSDPPSPWGHSGSPPEPGQRPTRRPQNRPHGIACDSRLLTPRPHGDAGTAPQFPSPSSIAARSRGRIRFWRPTSASRVSPQKAMERSSSFLMISSARLTPASPIAPSP